ncbi:MAG: N-acetylornithine carbamoyltransferase [Planctomycetota bacterium]|nr:MAG: N-acetylornithine carbamoyltransferase [Planctomycetota bacterium]
MSAIRHFYTLADLEKVHIEGLLTQADWLRGHRTLEELRGRAVICLYLAPSLRTRVSMELAARQLGAYVVTLTPGHGVWKLAFDTGQPMRGAEAEHIIEAVGVLGRYGDLLAVRAFPERQSWERDAKDPVLRAVMEHSPVPVLNLESTRYHPCQAAADILTIRRDAAGEPQGPVVLTWTDHPKALPVAVPSSFAIGITRMGWDLVVTHPEGYELPADVLETCRRFAHESGSAFAVTHDRTQALRGARYVYAKSWGRLDRYGDEQREIAERRERGLERWIVDEQAMALTNEARFLHCLPVRAGVVVSEGVLRGPRSLVLEQAENRLHIQKAILMDLLSDG